MVEVMGKRNLIRTALGLLIVSLMVMGLNGCSQLVSSSMVGITEAVATAVVNHDDPELVRSGIPAYMLILDGAIQKDPQNGPLLEKAAVLYTTYADAYVKESVRQKKLLQRAFRYGLAAVCSADKRYCGIRKMPFDSYSRLVSSIPQTDFPAWFALGAAWANWIRIQQGDVGALAEMPRVQLIMERIAALQGDFQHGSAHLYLGVLATVLPPALGGKPDKGKEHFQQAIQFSRGKNLMAKVLFAQYYARMQFNRPLHDGLLNEVITADPYQPDFTLINIMAQNKAQQLLSSADDYF
jgi:hypothetical protein